MIRLPMSPWWDPAIYVGMAKFLFSGGAIGMWETLRPPLWPVILGIPWIIGLNPLIVAQWLVALSGIGTMIMLYTIGEKEGRGLGLGAALILALSPVYTYFTAIPTNDIPSSLLALIAAFFVLRRRFTSAGIVTALSFLMRFPNGLFLVPFGLFILIDSIDTNRRYWISESIKNIFRLAFGFATLSIPYLIVNYFVFKDAFLPLKLGREIIETNYAEPTLYYVVQGVIDNPLLLLALVGITIYIAKMVKYKKVPASLLTLSLLCVVVIGGYMTSLTHKELRYSFGYLPYLVIIAAYGLHYLWHMSRSRYTMYIALAIIATIGSMNMWYQSTRYGIITLTPERKSYYEIPPQGSTTITSSPQVMLFSNTTITGVFSTWQYALDLLNSQKESLDYIAIDSSQIGCSDTLCTQQETELKKILSKTTLVYSAREGNIELLVYKLR